MSLSDNECNILVNNINLNEWSIDLINGKNIIKLPKEKLKFEKGFFTDDVKQAVKELKDETRKHFREMQTEEARKDLIACKLLEDLYLKNFDKCIDKIFGDKLSQAVKE